MLKAREVDFNILTVVHGRTAKSISRIYGFYRRSGFYYQQYIPCLDPLGEKRGGHSYSLTPQAYGDFLKKRFDLWYSDIVRGEFAYDRYFENLVGMLLGHPPESCGMLGRCAVQNVIEADGSVYPCDFYVLAGTEWENIKDAGFGELQRSEGARLFVGESENPIRLVLPAAGLSSAAVAAEGTGTKEGI
jgi:uncharacterized protein